MNMRLEWLVIFALAGCATNEGLQNTAVSPLVVSTSVGSGEQTVAPAYKAQAADNEKQEIRQRNLQPIAQRPAHNAKSPSTSSSSSVRTELNFKEADLHSVVRAMAQFTGRNFVVDPRINGQLSLVSDVPVDAETAYDMLLGALRMQGFAVVDVGGVSRIVPEADAKLLGGPVVSTEQNQPRGELVTRVFPLHYENATDLIPVLRPMVATNNPITAQPKGNALVITDYAGNVQRIAEVIAQLDTPLSVNTDVVPIEYGVALDVAGMAQQLLRDGSGGIQSVSVLADPRSNSVLLRAITPEKLKQARNLVLRLDTPESKTGNMHVVYLRNAQASHLAKVLRGAMSGQSEPTGNTSSLDQDMSFDMDDNDTMTTDLRPSAQSQSSFTAAGATIQADTATNTLIITAPDPLYRSIREVIDLLDQRRAQVLIESLIVEVNADQAAEFGVQWMAGGSSINNDSSAFFGGANFGGTGLAANLADSRTTIDALGKGLSLGVVNGTTSVMGTEILNLSVLARALQQKGGVNVLSTPNLMTMDNEQASIIVGRTVPFVTGSYTTSGDGASNPFQTVQREDVGLTLRIKPQISEGGTVKLALYQEVSSVDPSSVLTSGSIITRKRALETNVLVDNGQIIVLGGLLEDVVDDSTSSVPLLGDIPYLGNLFKYQKRTHNKTNLMLFLRPHIIRNARDSASLTLDRYNYMRAAQSGLQISPSWLMPNDQARNLPELQQNQETGLLDLRDVSATANETNTIPVTVPNE